MLAFSDTLRRHFTPFTASFQIADLIILQELLLLRSLHFTPFSISQKRHIALLCQLLRHFFRQFLLQRFSFFFFFTPLFSHFRRFFFVIFFALT